MKIWQAGEIISNEKWEALNNVTPRFKKVEWYDISNGILDISKTELNQLINNNCYVWTINNDGYVERIGYNSGYSITSTPDGRIQLTYQDYT